MYKPYYISVDNVVIVHQIKSDKDINCLCGVSFPHTSGSTSISMTTYREVPLITNCSACDAVKTRTKVPLFNGFQTYFNASNSLKKCKHCNLNHAKEPLQAYWAHTNLLAKEVADKCIVLHSNFNKNGFSSIKINKSAIDKEIEDKISTRSMMLHPRSVFDKVCLRLEEKNIEVKSGHSH